MDVARWGQGGPPLAPKVILHGLSQGSQAGGKEFPSG